MSIEDDIRSKLLLGQTPQQLIQSGYRKSTVYKVYGTTKAQLVPITASAWSINNLNVLNTRYLPNQTLPIGFTFRNDSPLDIYVYRIGIRAEWMPFESWYAHEVKELVKSGAQRWFSLPLTIPPDVKLGEYELVFGLDGQYLPTTQIQPSQVQWSEPVILELKKPFRGLTIFLSHSTHDMSLVRQLEASLDNEGIRVIIGEDDVQPGIVLDEKFQRLIQQSNVLIGLLTESGARSEWVLKEVNYGLQINKPCILLKDESVSLTTTREWISFSRNEHPEAIFRKIMGAIDAVQKNASTVDPIGGIIGAGLLLLVLGAVLGGSSK